MKPNEVIEFIKSKWDGNDQLDEKGREILQEKMTTVDGIKWQIEQSSTSGNNSFMVFYAFKDDEGNYTVNHVACEVE